MGEGEGDSRIALTAELPVMMKCPVLYCALRYTLHTWPSSIENVTSVTEELNFGII